MADVARNRTRRPKQQHGVLRRLSHTCELRARQIRIQPHIQHNHTCKNLTITVNIEQCRLGSADVAAAAAARQAQPDPDAAVKHAQLMLVML